MERKKKCVDSLRPTPGDIANHHKQMMIELRKVDVNVDAVRKLQKLSFLQRADDISNIHGTFNRCIDQNFEKLPIPSVRRTGIIHCFKFIGLCQW